MDRKTSRWIWAGIVMALVAVGTTLLVLALRARMKKKASAHEEVFEYDFSDETCAESDEIVSNDSAE